MFWQAKDLSHVFWRKAVAEGALQRNIVKPFVSLDFQEILVSIKLTPVFPLQPTPYPSHI
jgi:hypothetical protein